jgi:hypothetical protein
MPRSSTRPPVHEVLESISEKVAGVREAASGLNARIKEFEEVLSKLPGRTEAYFHGNHPDQHLTNACALSLLLGFEHKGKGWQLTCGTYNDMVNDDPENPVEMKPLIDAPLKFKIAAIQMFPDLLMAIEIEHEKLTKEINAANAEYDAFAVLVKQAAKGGK